MKRSTARDWQTGLGIAGGAANILGMLYNILNATSQQKKAGDAFQNWQSGNMIPASTAPSGGVDVRNPMGGEAMQIPLLETTPARLGPVDARALGNLYADMAGVDPAYSQGYLNAGNTMHSAHQAGVQAKADAENLRIEQAQEQEKRGYDTRSDLMGMMAGKSGQFDISDINRALSYLTSGEGDPEQFLSEREITQKIKPIGQALTTDDGVFVPYLQGDQFSAAKLDLKNPKRIGTEKQPGGGGGMTSTQRGNLAGDEAEYNNDHRDLEIIEKNISEKKSKLAKISSQLESKELMGTDGIQARKQMEKLSSDLETLNKDHRKIVRHHDVAGAKLRQMKGGSYPSWKEKKGSGRQKSRSQKRNPYTGNALNR